METTKITSSLDLFKQVEKAAEKLITLGTFDKPLYLLQSMDLLEEETVHTIAKVVKIEPFAHLKNEEGKGFPDFELYYNVRLDNGIGEYDILVEKDQLRKLSLGEIHFLGLQKTENNLHTQVQEASIIGSKV